MGDDVHGIALDIAEPERIESALAGIEHVDRLALVAVERDFNSARSYDIARARPYPGSTSITTVNGAVSSLIRTLAVELAPVRFNAVHPGIISDSPAWRDKKEAIAQIEGRTPGGRLATTEDVVGAVDFLFTNKGVNGINLVIDGGWLLT